MEVILFGREYFEDELADVSRDVFESIDETMNPLMSKVPRGKGKFTITVLWNDNNERRKNTHSS